MTEWRFLLQTACQTRMMLYKLSLITGHVNQNDLRD